MGGKMGIDAIRNFSTGKYSYNDFLKVKDWFANSEANKQAEELLYTQWQNSSGSNDASVHQGLFQKIHYKILVEEKGLEVKHNWWYVYKQLAAVVVPFLFIAGLTYLLLQPNQNPNQAWIEINAPIGARTEFLLPDGTSGWLNNGAKLKYPAVYSKHRKVNLTGEAYFHVSHHQGSDFTVSTEGLNVNVLGTKFNVSAYKDESKTTVVLEEGKVEVTGVNASFRHTLQPGESLTLDRDRKLLTSNKVDAATYTAWIKGYLVIDDEPMEEAFRKVGRWFNANMEVRGGTGKGLSLNATFREETLEEVLRFISMSTPISYRIISDKYDSNGFLEKTHVVIEIK